MQVRRLRLLVTMEAPHPFCFPLEADTENKEMHTGIWNKSGLHHSTRLFQDTVQRSAAQERSGPSSQVRLDWYWTWTLLDFIES